MSRLLLYLLIGLTPLVRGESEPAKVALEFLRGISDSGVDLGEDTAMLDTTTNEKRQRIEQDLEQLAQSLELGELQVVDQRIEGSLASILVSQVIDFDPERVEVHPVAMLQREGRWLPAPVISSFENTGISYIPKLAKAASVLEDWMLLTRNEQVVRLRNSVRTELLSDIRESKSPEDLIADPPDKVVNDFILACQKRDLPSALACLGGLEEPPPSSWEETLKLTAAAFRDPREAPGNWESVFSVSTLRALVNLDEFDDSAIISLGQIDPPKTSSSKPRISVRHFSLDRSDGGLWRLRLPAWLLDRDRNADDEDPTDRDLVEAFPKKLLERYPSRPFDSLERLVDSLIEALQGNDFSALLPHLGAITDPVQCRESLLQAARFWSYFHPKDRCSPLLLDLHQESDDACALVCGFEWKSPRIKNGTIKPVYFVRQGQNWTLAPAVTQAPSNPSISQWLKDAKQVDQAGWIERAQLVESLAEIAPDPAPNKELARDLAEAWLAAIQRRSPREVLSALVCIDPEKLLQIVGHEMQNPSETKIVGVHREGRWTAFTVRYTPRNRTDSPYHILFPIVSTPSGVRIFPEGQLFHANSRTSEFLNNATWSRLKNRLPEDAIEELEAIYQIHARLSEEHRPSE